MTEWIGLVLDVILIILVGAGVVQAVRLIRQLKDLRAGRADMDRFVRDFNAAVMRAEAGIKSLRSAARDTGDDLEKLIERGSMIRDELSFIVESADGVADRLSSAASLVLHGERSASMPASASPATGGDKKTSSASDEPATRTAPSAVATPAASRAEKELLQALQKLK